MTTEQFYHEPVLKNEIVDLLLSDKKGTYLDCTLGGGGHFRAVAAQLEKEAVILGIDQDSDAIRWNNEHPAECVCKVIIEKSAFSQFDKVLDKYKIDSLDGVLLDLGVSSWQIDNRDRGFSFMGDGELDMRMNRDAGIPASELIETTSEKQLAKILEEYGEVQNSRRMAHTIKTCAFPIKTTADLRKCLTDEYGQNLKYKVLAKVFQALRIAINDELGELRRFLDKVVGYLKPHGRIVVMAYHSLEDRIVKDFLRSAEQGCICPPHLPVCVCQKVATLKRITRKSVQASEEEVESNSRSRSVRVRAAEKIAGVVK